MIIHTTPITPEQIAAVTARMKAGSFTAGDLTQVAIASGVPESDNREYIANRVADRLIQKHRKAGNISITTNKPRITWAWKKQS